MDMHQDEEIEIEGYKLSLTCGACPEQYDVYKDGQKVGYMRLRHGYFYTAHHPGGDPVYEANTEGDGSFDPEEREQHLTAGVRALASQAQTLMD